LNIHFILLKACVVVNIVVLILNFVIGFTLG